MCVSECCVGDFDWFALWRLDPSLIYRLNLRVERLSEAILIHLGVECIFALTSLLSGRGEEMITNKLVISIGERTSQGMGSKNIGQK